MTKEVKEFFKANPKAEAVLQVGVQLFTTAHAGAARDCAMRNKLEVVEHKNGASSDDADKTAKAAKAAAKKEAAAKKKAEKAAAEKAAAEKAAGSDK